MKSRFIVALVLCLSNLVLIDALQRPGFCAMYDQCGPFGANCPYKGPAKPIDDIGRGELVKLCGAKFQKSNVCCTSNQVDTLKRQSKIAYAAIGGCPACWRNFLNFWCEFTCSPDQGTFLNVTDIEPATDKKPAFVKSVDFRIEPDFGNGFYDSCKYVKFGADNSYAMTLIGNGAKNYLEMVRFMGKKNPFAGSPIQIDFPVPSAGETGLNIEAYPCNSTQYNCACLDCEQNCPQLSDPKTSKCVLWGADCRQLVAMGLIIVFLLIASCMVAVKKVREWSESRQILVSERERLIEVSDSSVEVQPPALQNFEVEEDTVDVAGRAKGLTFSTVDTDQSGQPSYSVFFSQQYVNYPINTTIESLFYRIGFTVARNPVLTSILVLSIVLICSYGIRFIEVETDPVNLWVDPKSSVAQEKRFFDEHFGPFFRTEQIILTANDGFSPIVKKDSAEFVFEIVDQIQKIKSDNQTFKDLCFQPMQDGNCVLQSIAAYWQNDLDQFLSQSEDEEMFRASLGSCLNSPVSCLPPYMQPLQPEFVLGGYENKKDVMQAKALVITTVMNNYNEKKMKTVAEKWEIKFIELLHQLTQKAHQLNLTISFSTENSIEMELNRESAADIPTICMSYLLMFAYSSMALGKFSFSRRAFVESRFSLGFSGIIVVILSISSSVGLFSYAGNKVTLIIAEVIPFLVLAIGVDNIFILVHALDRESEEALPPVVSSDLLSQSNDEMSDQETLDRILRPSIPVENRIARALSRMGPSILLAAVTETVAFSLGAFVGLPAVRNFAILAAMSIFINFLLQITLFIACLTLDTIRRENGLLDLFPCWRLRVNPKYEASRLERFIKHYFSQFLLDPCTKLVVIVLFFAGFLTCIFLINRVELGLDQRIALPRDSYLVPYFDNLEKYFKVGPPMYWVVDGADASTFAVQQEICARAKGCSPMSVTNILEQERKRPQVSYISQPVASWIDDFIQWLDPNTGCCRHRKNNATDYCSPDDDDPDCISCLPDDQDPKDLTGLPKEKHFMNLLQHFLEMPFSEDCVLSGKAAYGSAVSLNAPQNTTTTAFHFRTYHSVLKSQKDFIGAYESARRIASFISGKNPGIKIFPYSIFYVFFDQYANLFSQAAVLLGFGLITIYISTLFFLGSMRHASIVSLVVTMITVDLIAVMSLWNVNLNAITLVNIIICTGISVEFCSHITRSFSVTSARHQMFSEGILMPGNLNRRTMVSLVEVGSSVFAGITLTKFIGICVLAFAQSKIFEIYYFRMYVAIVGLAFLHGFILLPVLLSTIGDNHIIRTGLSWPDFESQVDRGARPYSIYAEIFDDTFVE